MHGKTYNETLQGSFEEFVCDSNATWMLSRRDGVLDDVFDVEVCPYLVEHGAHTRNARVGEHDKLEVRGRLKVMQLVFSSAVGKEASLAH